MNYRLFAASALLTGGLAGTLGATPVIDNTPTRVQTDLRVGLRHIGTLRPKSVGEVSASRWTLDCAGMDREQVDWRSIREYVAPLGIARMRQQAGWARCEKDPGRYEFAWLDQAVFDAKRMGIDVWLELSYGNPAYPGGGGRQLAGGFPSSEEGLAAWDRWVERIVTHYKGTVRDFCIWNEPDLDFADKRPERPEAAVEFAIRTAEIIRRIVPDASIAAFALASANRAFVEPFVRELRRRDKVSLFTSIAYHHYSMNPDLGYGQVEACRKVIAEEAPGLKLWQGEGGTWSEWGASGALSHHHWTELAQAKYDLRRSLGDLGHGDDTEVFHLCDMEYRTSGFHDGLVRYGLVKTAGQAEGFRVLKVKTAYYAVQNAVSVFNDALESLAARSTSRVSGVDGAVAYDWRDRRSGLPAVVFWDASGVPTDSCRVRMGELHVRARPFDDPVWVDLITGNAYALGRPLETSTADETVYAVPVYDSPTFVTDRSLLSLDRSWFVRATGGWRDLPESWNVSSVRFYGPFPTSTVATTEAALKKLGDGRELRGTWDDFERVSRFDFRTVEGCPRFERGAIPDCVGFAVMTVASQRGGEAMLFEKNDWFGQFFVNGTPAGKPLEGATDDWTVVRACLRPGENEVVFRTSPGRSGKWVAAFGIGADAVHCRDVGQADGRTVDLSRVAVRDEGVSTEASKLAVRELKHHLELLSGTAFLDDAPFEFVFAKPADAPAPKPFESFYRIDGNRVWFWGEGNGTLFAVEEFLERELGFRWIWPGESGVVYTPRMRVRLPERAEHRRESKLMMAELRNGHQTKLRYDYDEVRKFIPQVSPGFFTETKADFDRIYEETDLWLKRMRIEPREKFGYGHAFTTWHGKYAKTHPEYLALVGGERGRVVERPDFVHLCVSNEATVDRIIADWLARGTNRFLNVCENDGGGYCECDGCRRYDVPRPEDGKIAHKTDRYVQFWNRIAKKARAIRPDVMLVSYLYSEYRLPPRRERIAYPDNILCGAVPSPMDDTEGLFKAWCAAGLRNFFLRPNHHHYLGEIHRGFERRLYEEFHNCLRMGLVGADYDANRVRPPQTPEFYVAARMMADQSLGFDEIMDEYCDGYGAAKAEVRAFFRAVHETADRTRREFAASDMRLGPSQLSIDGGKVTLQSYGRNETELTEKRDMLVRALAAHPEIDARSRARLENLILQCEHAIRTFRFIEGASLDDRNEFRRRADELLDFRLKHRTDLPDDYPSVFRKWWGEIQTWKLLRWPPKAKASDRGLDG